MNEMKPNMGVLKDYAKRQEEWNRRAADYEETARLRDEQKEKYERLRNQRLTEFMAGFNTISLKLKEMYQVRFALFASWWLLTCCLDDHVGRQRGARARG